MRTITLCPRAADTNLQQIADTYERLGNALSPTSPFPKLRLRTRIVSCLVLFILGSWFLSANILSKGTGLAIGVLLFGDPVIQRVTASLDQ